MTVSYLSGTGNSLGVAKDLAKSISDSGLVPTPAFLQPYTNGSDLALRCERSIPAKWRGWK